MSAQLNPPPARPQNSNSTDLAKTSADVATDEIHLKSTKTLILS